MKSRIVSNLLIALVLLMPMGRSFAQESTASPASATSVDDAAKLEELSARQYKMMKVHKGFAFTTAGLLLASGAVGTWHFIDMMEQGHKYRDSIKFEEGGIEKDRINEITRVWQTSQSQAGRSVHTALIVASVASYASTAAIELTMPNMYQKKRRIHRASFFLHAFLMAANAGLGIAESHALSQGKHKAVMGLGISHIAIGFAAPVIMTFSGIIFKLPIKD